MDGKQIITLVPQEVAEPPAPIPKQKRGPRMRRKLGWGWLAFLGSLVLVMALAAQAVLIEEDLERLSKHHDRGYVYIYGIAVLIMMLAWIIEEIAEEDWGKAIKGVAGVCFYHCYNVSIEGVYQSAKEHDLPQWQVALFSTALPDRVATGLSLLITVLLVLATLVAFDKFGKTGVAMLFHAHDVRKRTKRKKAKQ